MLVLTIRSDKPEAELGLYEDAKELAYIKWEAHMQLAETIHMRIESLLREQGRHLHDVQGVVAYQGPGSFTGLRIGLSVANALADGLGVPIIGSTGDEWRADGIAKLSKGGNDGQVIPQYGAPVHITQPKR